MRMVMMGVMKMGNFQLMEKRRTSRGRVGWIVLRQVTVVRGRITSRLDRPVRRG